MQSRLVSGEATFISAWKRRRRFLGEGYDGPFSGDIAVGRSRAGLLHGMSESDCRAV
jgi:hypothetical protein